MTNVSIMGVFWLPTDVSNESIRHKKLSKRPTPWQSWHDRPFFLFQINNDHHRSSWFFDPSFVHYKSQIQPNAFRSLFSNTTAFFNKSTQTYVDRLAWFWTIPYKQWKTHPNKTAVPLDLGLPSANIALPSVSTQCSIPSHSIMLPGTYHVVSNMRGPAAGRLDTKHPNRRWDPPGRLRCYHPSQLGLLLVFWFCKHLLEPWATRMLVNTVKIVLAKTINILGQIHLLPSVLFDHNNKKKQACLDILVFKHVMTDK